MSHPKDPWLLKADVFTQQWLIITQNHFWGPSHEGHQGAGTCPKKSNVAGELFGEQVL